MDPADRLDEKEYLEVVIIGLPEKTNAPSEELIKRLDQLQNDIAFICWALDSNWGRRERWEQRTGLKTTPSVVYLDKNPSEPSPITTVNIRMPEVPKTKKSFWGGNGKAKEARRVDKDYGDWA